MRRFSALQICPTTRTVLLLAVGLLTCQPLLASSYHPAIRAALFPVPEQLEPNVEFWRSIYADHTSDQALIHDERHLDVVYEVVELGDLDREELGESLWRRKRRDRVRAAEERVRSLLRELSRRPDLAGTEADRIRRLLAQGEGGERRYRDASWRVRSQTGLADRFAEAIVVSGRFADGIRQILEEEKVPVEVVCMPFVESMFNYRARSKVGASGAWQFTYATGRRYLSIDAAVDERSDVLLAARGAAKKLRDDYERLGTWPLALTAYNHGTSGMARAMRQLGTRDIGVISERYRSRTFGFASRNFYAEFLAALIVYTDRQRYFPDVEPDSPLSFDEFPAARFVALKDLGSRAGVEIEHLAELNPALSRAVFTGELLVPQGYRLRVPAGSLVDFEQAWAELPAESKRGRQLVTGYRVRRGDTLGSIARRHGTSVRTLQQANNLPRADRIYVGQYLVIPQAGGARPTAQVAASGAPSREATSHTVRRGETLTRIAVRYGVSEGELVAANGLLSPDHILVGQRLRIPGSRPAAGVGAEGGTHVVRRGETLFRIAMRYGTSVDTLVALNQLSSSLIRVGQVLRVPGGS